MIDEGWYGMAVCLQSVETRALMEKTKGVRAREIRGRGGDGYRRKLCGEWRQRTFFFGSVLCVSVEGEGGKTGTQWILSTLCLSVSDSPHSTLRNKGISTKN